MKILKEGDRSESMCPTCKARVPIRYSYRTVHLDETDIDVKNVLVGVCEKCTKTASIPAQSFPRLKEARERKSKIIEARIPLELDDIIRMIADYYHVSDQEFRSSLLRFYLYQIVKNESLVRRIKRLSEKDLACGKAPARVSLRLSYDLWNNAWTVLNNSGINDWSTVIRGIIVAAQEDVLGNRASRRREDLECIAAST